MISINEVLFFDTETTGLPEREAKWDVDYLTFPRICQLSWKFGDREENHIICPEGWEIPEEASAIHGITTERAIAEGELFDIVVKKFLADCHEAKLICGHNIYFDVSIIKSELMRLGSYDQFADDALFKGKRIDTMRPSMRWVDARFSNGRLKFPKLEELYARCFPGESFPAHDAIEDVRAVARCLPVLVENGLIELAVKEYPAEISESVPQISESVPANERNALNAPISDLKEENNKLHPESLNRSLTRNSAEIRKSDDVVKQLMADENF